jgi:hypothetical protein
MQERAIMIMRTMKMQARNIILFLSPWRATMFVCYFSVSRASIKRA